MATNTPATTVTSKEVKHSKIPLFYGFGGGKDEVSAVDLVDRIEALCQTANRNTDENKCNELYLALRGDAIAWYKSLKSIQISTTDWASMKKRFLKDYDFRIPGQVAYKLDVLRQKPKEKVIDFFSRVDVAIGNFFENFVKKDSATAQDTRYYFQLGIFIGGLRDELKSKVLMSDKVTTLVAARDYAQKLEFIELSKGKVGIEDAHSQILMMEGWRGRKVDEEGKSSDDEELEEDMVAILNRYKKKFVNHSMNKDAPFVGKCYNCGRSGHRSYNCKKPKRREVRSLGEEPYEDDQNEEGPENNTLAPIKNW